MIEESLTDPLGSFVVLGPGSFPSLANNENNSAESLQSPGTMNKSADNEISQNSCSKASSLIERDAQEKLNQLLSENYQLKETLCQNNLAIKTQLDTFFMWQQEVLKTHEAHKQKFLETKDLILKLKAENQNLKIQMENNLKKFSLMNKSDLEIETCKFPSSDEILNNLERKKLREEVDKFNRLYEDMKKNNECLKCENENLQKVVESLKRDMLQAQEKLKELEKEKEHMMFKNDTLNKSTEESYSLIPLPNLEARLQISNLLKQLEEETAKVSKLKQELELIKASQVAATESKNSPEKQMKGVHEGNDLDASFEKQNKKFDEFSIGVPLAKEKNSISEIQGPACQAPSETSQFKSHLNRVENFLTEREEAQKQFTRLLNDYKCLQQEINNLKSIHVDEEKYKNDLENLSMELKAKDEALKMKNEEFIELKESIKKLNLECEEVAILRVQAEVYQSDFNDERAEREKIAGEKEQMAEQIRLLQSRINDLEKESGNKNGSHESTSQSSGETKKANSHYVCPKCMMSFSTMRDCQEHIEDCLSTGFDF